MAEDNGTSSGDGQTGAGGTGDRGSREGQGSGTPQQQASGTPSESSKSIEKLEQELAKVRREAAEHRTKLKALEDEKLTETERLQKRLKELEEERAVWERERREAQVRERVAAAGRKAGALDPEILYRLIDPGAIEVDDAGNPKNLDALLKDLRESRPYLFGKAGSADGGAGRRSAAEGGMNDAIRRLAGRR